MSYAASTWRATIRPSLFTPVLIRTTRGLTMGRKKNLFAAEHPLHRSMRFARQRRRQWLQARMSFRAIAAADVRDDETNFGLWQIKQIGQLRSYQ